MQQPINYCDIMALGFTAEDGNDKVCKRLLMLLPSVKASIKAQRWFWPTAVNPHLYKKAEK